MTLSIRENIRRVHENVEKLAAGRAIKVIGVTKTVPPQRIQEAHEAGLHCFGENRIQEALPKIQQLAGLQIEWHFIGHLQTNKAREAVRHFSCIQSVDSLKLLQQIEKEAEKVQKKINFLLEINLGGEESKHGFVESAVAGAVESSRELKWGNLCGLMIIPPYFEDAERVRPFFGQLRRIAEQHRLSELSMGMSHDYRIAIEEGATMVRIGTAIFGTRG